MQANPQISGRTQAAQEIGDKGNDAVRMYIASALEHCPVQGLHVSFKFCNLNETSVLLLANALEKNTCLGGFTCIHNPFNFPNGKDYDRSTDLAVKRAVIATNAPIVMWNNLDLPRDVVDARKAKTTGAGQGAIALPTVEELAHAQKTRETEQVVLQECCAKFDADNKLVHEFESAMRFHEQEAKKMRDRVAQLKADAGATQARIVLARANIEKSDKLIERVEEAKRSLGPLFGALTVSDGSASAVSSPPASPARAATAAVAVNVKLCTLCNERAKNRFLYKCGHRFCAECADELFSGSKICPTCDGAILDVLPYCED